MKKLIVYILSVVFLGLPFVTQASSTYTCSISELAPITVNNPGGADAATVSAYNTKCINAGGTVSGPSAQQISAQAQTAYSDCMAGNGPVGTPVDSDYCAKQAQAIDPGFQKPTYTPPVASPAPTPAAAGKGQLTYVPLEPLPGGAVTGKGDSYNSLSAYLTLMFNILLSLGAMVAVITLVLGGITYIVSEVVDKKAAARRRMQASVIGLLLLLTCWLILNTINPNLTKLCIFNLDQQCGGSVANGAPSSSAPAGSPGAPPSREEANQAEASCKAQGNQCANNPKLGGGFSCVCPNAL